jgi:hypothetical protein
MSDISPVTAGSKTPTDHSLRIRVRIPEPFSALADQRNQKGMAGG